MDQSIKQRLVGIAVVFALAVIFLPMILDGSGLQKKHLKVEIPMQPEIPAKAEFEQKIIELQARVDELPELEPRFIDEASSDKSNRIEREADKITVTEPVTKVETAEVEKEKVVEKPSSEPETTASKPVGGDSWVLQVGSYRDKQKALSQRDKLRKSKIAAVFIEQFSADGQVSYRVRLGPFINRDQSRVAQNKIRAKYNIDGLIMKYER
ncbi:MAG: SPOR domain-containing protein [Gammaproteobacteria bacterium]|nr:SPOR domain-containing protein [Gammaproteobacteria bacterium]